MENKMFKITEEEQKIVTQRTEDIAQAVAAQEGRAGYYAYAAANGYTEEEAHTLIDEVVIPTVDEYNNSCREAFEGDTKTWILDKMAQSIEAQGMDIQEAAKYKLGVLQAVRKLNAGAVQEDADVLTDDEKAMLEAAEFTDEMIGKIDEALVESIDNSAMPLYASEAFDKFLEGKADAASVSAVTWDLWRDNELKYCAAAAMCIARRNGQLPSIPAETTDACLVLGACQGVDVVNIEKKVSTGEMVADTAYKILKVIGAVVLTVAAVTLLMTGLSIVAAVSMEVAFELLGTGLLGCVVACVAAFGVMMIGCSDETCETLYKGIELIGKGADIAYETLKRGAKAVYRYTVENIVPAVKAGVAYVKDFLCTMVSTVRQYVQNKGWVHARA